MTYGCTLRGPASRLPGSTPSLSSLSAGGALRAGFSAVGGTLEDGSGGAAGRSAFRASSAASASGAWTAGAGLRGVAITVGFLRGCGAAPMRGRGASGLRTTGFLVGGRLAAFLPFADFGAGLLADINDS